MSAAAVMSTADERLLTFELAGALYALPIDGVLEVAEASRVTCIPTLPMKIGGVINYHGDALPVMRCSSLFPVDESELCEPTHVLVVTDRAGDVPDWACRWIACSDWWMDAGPPHCPQMSCGSAVRSRGAWRV